MTSEEKRQRHKEGHRSRVEAARIAQARAARRQRLVVAGVVGVLAVVVVAAGVLLLGDDDDETAAEATTTSTTLAESTTTSGVLPAAPPGRTLTGETPCPAEDGSEERVSQFAQAPPTCIDPGTPLEAVIETTEGPITIALDAEAAPTMVNNFVVLARYHYFDGVPFHRLMPDFVAQSGSSGIPDYGSGGPGYDMPDVEKPTGAYEAGDVAMARSDAVSGSQFFIVVSDSGAAQLGPEYPLFGQVTEGLDLAAELAAKGDLATNGTPLEQVLIETVTIRPAGG